VAPFKWVVPATESGPEQPSTGAAATVVEGSSAPSIMRRLARYPWRALLRLLAVGDHVRRRSVNTSSDVDP